MERASQPILVESPTGLEDVIRSLRALLRSIRHLSVATAQVAERELAMGISISEQIRDQVISQEALSWTLSIRDAQFQNSLYLWVISALLGNDTVASA